MRIRFFALVGLLAVQINSQAAAPSITVQPASQAAMPGSNVTFTVTVSGTTPLHYQWALNRGELGDRTNDLLVLTALKPEDAGAYTVVITNMAGAITSQIARLELVSGFTRVTNSILGHGGQPLGAAWGDFNNDGWVDLFMASNAYLIHTNRGDGTFQLLTSNILAGESSGGRLGAGWADFDNDGQLDLAVAGNTGTALYLYRNLGNGKNFARVSSSIFNGPGMQMFAPAWGDYDNDGFVDLFVAVTAGNDLLFHNHGDGTFSKITNSVLVRDGAPSQSAIWGDFNGDGYLDLYTTEPNASRNPLYRNDGGGNFSIVTNGPIATDGGNQAGGCVWGDFDNDGDLDLFVTSFSFNAYFYRNDGGGVFTKVSNSIVVLDGPSAGCTALDFDNDGWLDLVSPGPKNLLYHNNRDGSFTKVTTGDVVAQPVVSWGNNSFAVADVNRDGFEDLLWVDFNGNSQLYLNDGNSNGWLTVRCEGRLSNRSGIGAKVRVKTVIAGQEVRQFREISGGGVVFAQNEMVAHFGMGDATNITLVRIEWPSGIVQEFHNVAPRQFLTVIEPDARITPAALELQAGESATFTVSTTLAPPVEFQWKRNGVALAGETNSAVFIADVQAHDAGVYSVTITQPATGLSFDPRPASLAGPVRFTQQPTNVNVRPGASAVFTVNASGIGPIRYQWRYNGADIPGATNVMLTLTNCQMSDAGIFDVVVLNSFGPVASAPAALGILINPAITVQPLSQSVVLGGSVTLSVAITGSPAPFVFEWRRASSVISSNVTSDHVSFFTLTNVQSNQAGNYRVVIKNAADAQHGIISSNVVLTVLADTDRDGLPDDWEIAHGLSITNSADAALDRDGDGVSNREEYLAGTDPDDPKSFLHIENIRYDNTPAWHLQFLAVSNHTYSVQAGDAFNSGAAWRSVADILAMPTNRTVEIIRPVANASPKFLRLVTPRIP